MPTFNTTIGEGLTVEVDFYVDGEDHPATMIDPAEHAVRCIESVTVNGCDISDALNKGTWAQLQTECEEYTDV